MPHAAAADRSHTQLQNTFVNSRILPRRAACPKCPTTSARLSYSLDECVRVEGNQADVHERLRVRVHFRDGVEGDRPRGGRWFSALALICTACDVFVV